MRLLLLHLSDLHIKGEDDPVLTRPGHIARALQDFDHEIGRCVIAMSGDLSFSGKADQLAEGWEFIIDLKEELEDCLVNSGDNLPINFVAVPGNHDCDFDLDNQLRHAAREQILSEHSGAADDSLVDACTEPQRPFFEYCVDELMESRLNPPDTPYPEELYYERVIRLSEDGYLRFRCCNTAWLSDIDEDQGELYFPPDAVRESSPDGDELLTVTLFHHPYNWLEANSARQFRERVEAESDIILTGHEHNGSWSKHSGERGERNQYIEAGPLQESNDPASSSFNALIVDIESKQQKYRRYTWGDDRYKPEVESDSWEAFQINKLRAHSGFDLSEATLNYLRDLGTTVDHPRVGRLELGDIFVYPNLRKVNSEADDFPRFTSGSKLRDRVREHERVLISGEDKSGKTSLLKKLFLDLLRDGFIPLLLQGDDEEIPDSEEKWTRYLEDLFCSQYGEDQLEKYRQLPRDKRVLILDDYHHLSKHLREGSSLLNFLCHYSDHVVVTINDILAEVEEFTQSGSGSDDGLFTFSHYSIRPFGNQRRDEIIKKWVTLGRAVSPQRSDEIIRQREELRHLLDAIFGNDFVPAYPSYILPVLYAREASVPVDPNVGTHGYFYSILIKSDILEGHTQNEVDVLTGYLSHLAYYMFTNDLKEITEGKFYDIHDKYQDDFDITRHGGEMLEYLLGLHILDETAGMYCFRRDYYYYYFVAEYISDRPRNKDIQENISHLCKNLHIEENSNILLFLVHKSKDSLIIEELLGAASELLPNQDPATLDEDADFFDDLRQEVEEIVYKDEDVEKSRRELLEQRDKIERNIAVSQGTESETRPASSDSGDSDPVMDPTRHAGIALRTLNILGQVLKNFPGTLEKTPKLEVAKASYELGLRTLSYILGVIRDTREDLIYEVVDRIRSENPDVDIMEIREQVRDLVASICQGVSFGMIRRTVNAVGSSELSKTYQRVLDHRDSPATRLINVSLELNYTKKSPTGNVVELAEEFESKPLPLSLLRYMVLRHFKLFPVDREDKQRICEALDISYKRARIESAGSAQKMISE